MATLNIIPTAGQTLNQTRDPIRNNFTSLQNVFGVDHATYGSVNEGKHNQITFPAHVGAIGSTAGELYLFNQTAAPTNVPDIWLKRGAGTAFPMTGSGNAVNGWTYLPSGILLKWGSLLVGDNTNFNIDANQGPSYAITVGSVFSVQLTGQSVGTNPFFTIVSFGSGNPTPNRIVARCSNNSGGTVQYLMMGI